MINPKLVEFFKRTRKTLHITKSLPEISPGIVVESRIRPVPIGPLSEAHQREGLPDGIRWVFLKDLRKHSGGRCAWRDGRGGSPVVAVDVELYIRGFRVTVRRDVVQS